MQDLQTNLDSRIKQILKMELKIKELEDALSVTNEKRYKLQDTIGNMEKELQSTKAHINQMADMQTRYATTGMPSNDQLNNILKELDLRKRTQFEPEMNFYKNHYLGVKRSDMLRELNAEAYVTNERAFNPLAHFNAQSNYISNNNKRIKKETLKFATSSTVFHSLTKLYKPHPIIDDFHEPSSHRSYNISVTSTTESEVEKKYVPLINSEKGCYLGRNETYKPLLMNGIEKYHVLKEGALMWCKPNKDMLCNNSLITQDIIAQSCKEIRRNIDESLKIIEDHHLKQIFQHNNR